MTNYPSVNHWSLATANESSSPFRIFFLLLLLLVLYFIYVVDFTGSCTLAPWSAEVRITLGWALLLGGKNQKLACSRACRCGFCVLYPFFSLSFFFVVVLAVFRFVVAMWRKTCGDSSEIMTDLTNQLTESCRVVDCLQLNYSSPVSKCVCVLCERSPRRRRRRRRRKKCLLKGVGTVIRGVYIPTKQVPKWRCGNFIPPVEQRRFVSYSP